MRTQEVWGQRWGRICGCARALLIVLMFPSTAFAALLSLSDPLGDAVGDGSLASPTAEGFRDAGLDVRSLNVLEGDTFTFQLELAGLANRFMSSSAEGPIIELYLDSEPGGPQTLLPGSGMQISSGWEVAFQIAGGRLRVFTPGDSDNIVDATSSLDARLTQEGDVLSVTTSLETPRRFSLYGMLGSYDPFNESGWRNVAREPSPWHFSSPTQSRNVLDVMVDDPALQARAVERGVLPEIRTSFRSQRWLIIAAAGALVALIGFALRLFAPAPREVEPVSNEPARETDNVLSYGAQEAGERAQILRSVDFETLRAGEWLEPLDGTPSPVTPKPNGRRADSEDRENEPPELNEPNLYKDDFAQTFDKEFGD